MQTNKIKDEKEKFKINTNETYKLKAEEMSQSLRCLQCNNHEDMTLDLQYPRKNLTIGGQRTEGSLGFVDHQPIKKKKKVSSIFNKTPISEN